MMGLNVYYWRLYQENTGKDNIEGYIPFLESRKTFEDYLLYKQSIGDKIINQSEMHYHHDNIDELIKRLER